MEKLLTHEQAVGLVKALWEAFDRGYTGQGALARDLMDKDRLHCYQMGVDKRKREARG